MERYTHKSGFSIVELLVVIVILAILAAIVIVSYNGIQDRAEAAKTANAVRAYKNALKLYKIDNGSYPVTGAMCLGDQYPTFTGGTLNACRNSAQPIDDETNAAGRNLLKPYMSGQLPMPSTKQILAGGNEYIGAHFYGSSYDHTLDGVPVVVIEYFVKTNKCPVGPVYSSGTEPAFFSPAVDRSSSMSGADGSRCYLPLPEN